MKPTTEPCGGFEAAGSLFLPDCLSTEEAATLKTASDDGFAGKSLAVARGMASRDRQRRLDRLATIKP